MSELNRAALKEQGLTKEQIDYIMDLHGKDVSKFQGNAKELTDTKATNNELNKQISELANKQAEILNAFEQTQAQLKQEKEASEKQAREMAISKSINSLGEEWDKELLNKLCSNAEIENGEIKDFASMLESFKNLYKPVVKSGFKHQTGQDIKPGLTFEEVNSHIEDQEWLIKHLDEIREAQKNGTLKT